jgi:hypothetical protein
MWSHPNLDHPQSQLRPGICPQSSPPPRRQRQRQLWPATWSGDVLCRYCRWSWRKGVTSKNWETFIKTEGNFKSLAIASSLKVAGISLFAGGTFEGVCPRRRLSGSRVGEVSGYWPASLCAEEPFRAQPPGQAATSTFEASASREPAAAALPRCRAAR